MTQDDERIIKPPIERVVSGRVFHPDNAFLYKKWLRVFIVLIIVWVALWGFKTLMSNLEFATFMTEWIEFSEVFILIDWIALTQTYWIIASSVFALWMIYTFIYVKHIDYSLASWEGDVSPEIYVRKGIIQITQRHVPFRTVTNLRTRRGVFDRLFGIGTIQIETAAKPSAAQGGGIIAIILQKLMRGGTAQENIEGVRFHEELRDFILRELRGFGKAPFPIELSSGRGIKRKIFNQDTLEAFRNIRDELVLRQKGK
ncbi:MAG: PH domain-containing protein [Candidatus Thorarchaeota archaeon]